MPMPGASRRPVRPRRSPPGYLHPSARIAAFEETDRATAQQKAARQQALARELEEIRRDWEELKREFHAQPFESKWDGQPRDHGRYSFGKKPTRVQLAGDITGFTKHGINQAISRGVSLDRCMMRS